MCGVEKRLARPWKNPCEVLTEGGEYVWVSAVIVLHFLKSLFPVWPGSHRAIARAFLLAAASGVAESGAAIFKNGFVDHSICCASGGPLSFDGTAVRGNDGGAYVVTDRLSRPAETTSGEQSNLAAGSLKVAQPASAGSAPAATSGEGGSAAQPGPPQEVEGHLQLEFARLSDFKIEAPAYDPAVKPEEALAAVEKQIPDAIKRLDGKRAQITGFMLPVKMEGQLVSQFLLMRDQMMCCYGVVPRMNDWIVVYAAKPVRFTPDVPISFRGKLSVKAMQEQGFITGIYLLEEATPGKL
jgi:hypothetical protein